MTLVGTFFVIVQLHRLIVHSTVTDSTTCSGWWPWWRRWITASLSGRRVTRTRRWWCGTSTTTPAGRSCSPPSSRAGPGSAWSAPSYPGTSLSCCLSGRRGLHPYSLQTLVNIVHLSGGPCPRRGQHGGPEARDLHAAVRAVVRRDLRGGGAARRGLQRGDGGRRHGPGAGRAPARGQGGVTANGICSSCCLHSSKVAFTGSTEIGKVLRRATAGTGKKISLELGGKSPVVVFDSADLDSAVESVVDAIWFNQGQVIGGELVT